MIIVSIKFYIRKQINWVWVCERMVPGDAHSPPRGVGRVMLGNEQLFFNLLMN